MDRAKLTVEKRTVIGKKVKDLRKSGFIPANIYGNGLESVAIQMKQDVFASLFDQVGATGLVDVLLDGQTHPILIHRVQRDYMTQRPIHADFFQVNLKEKIRTMVPVVITGEAAAVTEKIGMVMQPLAEVEVEALPDHLPEHIEIDVTSLAAIDDQFLVSDLKLPQGVTITSEPDLVVVKITELVSKEAQEQAAAEAAAAESAKAETAPAEGEAAPVAPESQPQEEAK